MKLVAFVFYIALPGVIRSDFKFNGSARRPGLVKVDVGPICNASEEGSLVILNCKCSDVKELKLGYQTPHARKIFIRYFQTKSDGLRISDCEELHIFSNLQWVVPNARNNAMKYFGIQRIGSFYPYESRVFDFSFQANISVDIHFDHIDEPIKFPTNIPEFPYFKGSINLIMFNSLRLLDFNTNGLYGVSASKPVVIFRNCTIKTKDPGSESVRIGLTSLDIIDSSLNEAGRGSFNISTPIFKVTRSNIQLISGKSFDIDSDKTEFSESKIGFQANSLRIKSEVINFINTTFNQPKTLSMIELHPKSFNGPDIVRFKNITLIDPSRGALVTGGFRVLEFENIAVSNCLCDLHKYLLDASTPAITLRILPEFEVILQMTLKNNSRCYDKRIGGFRVIEDCEDVKAVNADKFDIIYISVASILLLGIVSVIATVLTVYLLNKRNRDKRIALIKDWSIAMPKPSSYRETMVKFNFESVQTFSRPSSLGYAEYRNEPDVIQGLDKVVELRESQAKEEGVEVSKSEDPSDIKSTLEDREVRTALSTIIEEDDLIALNDFDVYNIKN